MSESKNDKIYYIRIYSSSGGGHITLFKNTDYDKEFYELGYINFYKDKNKAIEEGIKYFKEKWTESWSFEKQGPWKENITEHEDYICVTFLSDKCHLPYSFRVYSTYVK